MGPKNKHREDRHVSGLGKGHRIFLASGTQTCAVGEKETCALLTSQLFFGFVTRASVSQMRCFPHVSCHFQFTDARRLRDVLSLFLFGQMDMGCWFWVLVLFYPPQMTMGNFFPRGKYNPIWGRVVQGSIGFSPRQLKGGVAGFVTRFPQWALCQMLGRQLSVVGGVFSQQLKAGFGLCPDGL